MNKPAQYKALIVALLLSASFLIYVLAVPNMFNMLPFAIYESINPNGVSEQTFIVLFDVVAAALLLLPIYKLLYNFFAKI